MILKTTKYKGNKDMKPCVYATTQNIPTVEQTFVRKMAVLLMEKD